MGPSLILDKSVLEALSTDELRILRKYYYHVVPPVLISEIRADLKKKNTKGKTPEKRVRILARKLSSTNTCLTAHVRDMCTASLLGHEIPMDRRPVRTGGIPYYTKELGYGLVFPESPEQELLRHWGSGRFTENDLLFADMWRKSIKQIDLEAIRRKYGKVFGKLETSGNLKDLVLRFTAGISESDQRDQLSYLSYSLDGLAIDEKTKTNIYNRWLAKGLQSFEKFAPYAFYCFKADVIFHFGVILGIIKPKQTNPIDLEYISYLPFCRIFSSNDDFHKQIIEVFIENDQEFVDGEVLKKDLLILSEEWKSLSKNDKKNRIENYGHYPPEMPESFTYRCWQKYMGPRTIHKPSKMTDEEQELFFKKIKPVQEFIDRLHERKKEN